MKANAELLHALEAIGIYPRCSNIRYVILRPSPSAILSPLPPVILSEAKNLPVRPKTDPPAFFLCGSTHYLGISTDFVPPDADFAEADL